MPELSHVFVRVAIGVIVVVGCRGTSPESYPEGCGGPIQVTMLSGPPPAFNWSPACGISHLVVTKLPVNSADPEETVWGIQVPELAPLGPIVSYGAAPNRATEWTAPKQLIVGQRYRVSMRYIVGGDGIAGSGALTFTWFPPD